MPTREIRQEHAVILGQRERDIWSSKGLTDHLHGCYREREAKPSLPEIARARYCGVAVTAAIIQQLASSCAECVSMHALVFCC